MSFVLIRRDKRQPKYFDKYTVFGLFDSYEDALSFGGYSEEATGMGEYPHEVEIVEMTLAVWNREM